MTTSLRIDLGEASRYPLADSRWLTKAALTAVLAYVPILNFAVVGYELEIARRVAAGDSTVLPEWDDLSGFFRRGLALALARYLYSLPIFVVALLPLAAGAGILFATSDGGSDLQPLLLLGACGIGFVLMMMIAFLIGGVSPAVAVRYLQVGTFASCFDLPAIVRQIRVHPAAHLRVFLFSIALSLGLSLAIVPGALFLSLIPCVGQFAYIVLLMAMLTFLVWANAHLEGQLLRAVGGRALVKGDWSR